MEDFEKKYEKALKYLKTFIDGDCVTESDILADFPELQETEDERMRKALIDYFKGGKQDFMSQDAVAWLEKQKEPEKEELVYRLNGLMQEYINEAKDQEEEEHRFKCYKLFWNALEDASYFEQKEQKPVADGWSMKDAHFHGNFLYLMRENNSKEGWEGCYEWLEELPSRISLEHRPVEKQDDSGLNDLERAILRGFLCAGVENVPVTIIKETARDCLAHIKPVDIHIDNPNIQKFDPDVKVTTSDSSASGKELLYVSNKSYDIGFRDGVASVKPVEWSEEDEKMLIKCISAVMTSDFYYEKYSIRSWLESLRPQPHWKPSEEQIECLRKVVYDAEKKHAESTSGYDDFIILRSLLQELIRQL